MGKVHTRNLAPLEYPFELYSDQPIDNRFSVIWKSDLTNSSTWEVTTEEGTLNATYHGMLVAVVGDKELAENRGVYYLSSKTYYDRTADDESAPNYHPLGWKKIGGESIAFDEYTIQKNENNKRYVANVDGGNY